MNINVLYFDTETTGTDEKYDSIIQLAGFLRVNGKEVETFNWKIKPYNSNPMNPRATAVHGITAEEASTYPDHKIAYKEFIEMMDRNGIGPDNKAFVLGYNSSFDVTMLKGLFQKNGDFYLWKKYIYSPDMDVMRLASFALWRFRYALENFHLDTVYKFLFNETFQNHDAFADIRATERVFNFINEKFFGGYFIESFLSTSSDDSYGQLELDFSPKIPVRSINK